MKEYNETNKKLALMEANNRLETFNDVKFAECEAGKIKKHCNGLKSPLEKKIYLETYLKDLTENSEHAQNIRDRIFSDALEYYFNYSKFMYNYDIFLNDNLIKQKDTEMKNRINEEIDNAGLVNYYRERKDLFREKLNYGPSPLLQLVIFLIESIDNQIKSLGKGKKQNQKDYRIKYTKQMKNDIEIMISNKIITKKTGKLNFNNYCHAVAIINIWNIVPDGSASSDQARKAEQNKFIKNNFTYKEKLFTDIDIRNARSHSKLEIFENNLRGILDQPLI
jgi:hypothetical protein